MKVDVVLMGALLLASSMINVQPASAYSRSDCVTNCMGKVATLTQPNIPHQILAQRGCRKSGFACGKK